MFLDVAFALKGKDISFPNPFSKFYLSGASSSSKYRVGLKFFFLFWLWNWTYKLQFSLKDYVWTCRVKSSTCLYFLHAESIIYFIEFFTAGGGMGGNKASRRSEEEINKGARDPFIKWIKCRVVVTDFMGQSGPRKYSTCLKQLDERKAAEWLVLIKKRSSWH